MLGPGSALRSAQGPQNAIAPAIWRSCVVIAPPWEALHPRLSEGAIKRGSTSTAPRAGNRARRHHRRPEEPSDRGENAAPRAHFAESKPQQKWHDIQNHCKLGFALVSSDFDCRAERSVCSPRGRPTDSAAHWTASVRLSNPACSASTRALHFPGSRRPFGRLRVVREAGKNQGQKPLVEFACDEACHPSVPANMVRLAQDQPVKRLDVV
jgi:hypothetical protein